jgi:hypothetical protein
MNAGAVEGWNSTACRCWRSGPIGERAVTIKTPKRSARSVRVPSLALPTAFGRFVGQIGIGGIVVIAVYRRVDVLDYIVKRCGNRLAAFGSAEIALMTFGMGQENAFMPRSPKHSAQTNSSFWKFLGKSASTTAVASKDRRDETLVDGHLM